MKECFNKQGFTLIELLLAISIFSLLTTFMVVNYAFNEKTRSLKLEVSKILVGLQKAENMAITGQVFDLFTPSVYEFSLSNEGDNCLYVLSAKDASGENKEIETQHLKGIKIKDSKNSLVFKFLPPRGRLKIIDKKNEENEMSSIKINIGSNDVSYCLEVSSLSGKISLKNDSCDL